MKYKKSVKLNHPPAEKTVSQTMEELKNQINEIKKDIEYYNNLDNIIYVTKLQELESKLEFFNFLLKTQEKCTICEEFGSCWNH